MLGCLLLPKLYVLCVLFLFFSECGERKFLHRSMRPRMKSYQDETLPPEPPARHSGRGRGRPRGAVGRRRQRELQDKEPINQDFEGAA